MEGCDATTWVSKTAGVRWVVTLCRVQPFLVGAAVAVGSTAVPHPRRKFFSSEAGCPAKGTKMETVRVVEEGVLTQNIWLGRLWWDCKPRTFQNHHRHPVLLLTS